MGQNKKGQLLIIGGSEDKSGNCEILQKFVRITGGGLIAVITAATQEPTRVGKDYTELFMGLGSCDAIALEFPNRSQVDKRENLDIIARAKGIFFTGGDQLRITSLLGGTKFEKVLLKAYCTGAVVAGTSAGAAVMGETMIIGGANDESPKLTTVNMAPGMGLLSGVVIDQHFAQRGRIGRLLTAVAENPGRLGLGIDEDTAILATDDESFQVIGSQTVTVIDGTKAVETNVSESSANKALAITNLLIHVLPEGYGFNYPTRIPFRVSP